MLGSCLVSLILHTLHLFITSFPLSCFYMKPHICLWVSSVFHVYSHFNDSPAQKVCISGGLSVNSKPCCFLHKSSGNINHLLPLIFLGISHSFVRYLRIPLSLDIYFFLSFHSLNLSYYPLKLMYLMDPDILYISSLMLYIFLFLLLLLVGGRESFN